MQGINDIKAQNDVANRNIASILDTVNTHSNLIKAHEENIFDLQANVADLENALAGNSALPQIIITGIPLQVKIPPQEIVDQIFHFINFKPEIESFVSSPRIVTPKAPNPTSLSIIIDVISDSMCEKILEFAAKKRNKAPLSNRDIFGQNFESNLYINKVLPPYIRDLAYTARRLKTQKGWTGTWVNRGQVFVKPNPQSNPIIVSTQTQLSSIK